MFNEEIAFKPILYFWLLFFENLPLYQLARSFKGNFSLQFYFKGFMIYLPRFEGSAGHIKINIKFYLLAREVQLNSRKIYFCPAFRSLLSFNFTVLSTWDLNGFTNWFYFIHIIDFWRDTFQFMPASLWENKVHYKVNFVYLKT